MSRTSGYTYSVLFSYPTIEVLLVLVEVIFTPLVRKEPVTWTYAPIEVMCWRDRTIGCVLLFCKPSKHQGVGGYALRLQERLYETFHIVLFAGNELFAYNVYAKEKLRTYFSCAMFDHLFGYGSYFYCVESIHVNIEFSFNCMKFI